MSTPDLFGDAPAGHQPQDIVAAADQVADSERWPRQLAELTDLLADELMRRPPRLPAPEARRHAARLAARLARDYGGQYLYIPKGDSLARALRDARLWAEFDGTVHGAHGVAQLARREGLTQAQVYNILRAQRALHLRAVQPDLFDALDTSARG